MYSTCQIHEIYTVQHYWSRASSGKAAAASAAVRHCPARGGGAWQAHLASVATRVTFAHSPQQAPAYYLCNFCERCMLGLSVDRWAVSARASRGGHYLNPSYDAGPIGSLVSVGSRMQAR